MHGIGKGRTPVDKKLFWLIVLFLLLFILFVVFLGAWRIASRIIHPPKVNDQTVINDLKTRLKLSPEEFKELLGLPYEPVMLRSNYNYNIRGRLFDLGAKRSVILLHREGRNLMASYKFLRMYQSLGYNVLLCDARYHGQTGGPTYSYGFFERWDLKVAADFLFERYGAHHFLGFHGESAGAATSLMTLSQDPRISFAIADSSFSELTMVMQGLEERILKTRSQKALMLINQIVKRRAGFSLADVSPLTEIQALEVPVLFIHSGGDELVAPKMSRLLASFKSGYNQIYIAPDSPHLLGYYEHTAEYEQCVRSFLSRIEELYALQGRSYL
ncbi:hypothetical protein ABB02_00402 [Clostridiaceae bacterium JG1575]|nr:hypothetical protein ABB02_00402 [Clostridiaceae bacterium JG1575]